MIQPDPGLLPAIEALTATMDQRFDRLLAVPDDPRRRLYEAVRHATMGGGKRLRPLLVVAACDLFNVEKDRSLRLAIAVECVHCYSLVHDDLPCMDDDAMRRGKPTVHIAFDEATAVLTGDALLTLAFQILADEETHGDPRVRCELVAELARAAGLNGMVGGQAMDMAAQRDAFDLHTTTRLQQLKTGAMIAYCVDSGAIMGRASAEQRTHLRGYAHDLGLAFQIIDDLLDIEGDAVAVGKAVGKDAAASKATLVSHLGIEAARERASLLIDQAIMHLASFGREADLLRAIAGFAFNRNR